MIATFLASLSRQCQCSIDGKNIVWFIDKYGRIYLLDRQTTDAQCNSVEQVNCHITVSQSLKVLCNTNDMSCLYLWSVIFADS